MDTFFLTMRWTQSNESLTNKPNIPLSEFLQPKILYRNQTETLIDRLNKHGVWDCCINRLWVDIEDESRWSVNSTDNIDFIKARNSKEKLIEYYIINLITITTILLFIMLIN